MDFDRESRERSCKPAVNLQLNRILLSAGTASCHNFKRHVRVILGLRFMFFTWKNGITDYSNEQLLLSQNSELSNLMMCCDLMFGKKKETSQTSRAQNIWMWILMLSDKGRGIDGFAVEDRRFMWKFYIILASSIST